MEPQMNRSNVETETPRSRPSGATVAAVVLFAALIGANAYLLKALHDVKKDVAVLTESLSAEVAAVRENSALEVGRTQQSLAALEAELEAARKQVATATGQARTEAKRHAETLAKRLAEEQRKQQEQQQQLASELADVKQETETRFEAVSTDVGAVKTEVAFTREQLDSTVGNLQQVRGDLGVMSGRIATNADELTALKALGEREYFEFDIVKTSTPQRVAEISIQLKGADAGKNKFTIDVFADDQRIRKKDKSLNEPIQFYAGGRGGLPYEVVVYDVKDGRIIGYLAKPKMQMARR